MQLLDFFVWRLFLLLLPGVLIFKIYGYLTGARESSISKMVINSVLYGLFLLFLMEITSSVFTLISALWKHETVIFGLNLDLWKSLLYCKDESINLQELIIYYLLTVPFSFVLGFILSKKAIFRRFLKKINMDPKSSEGDVWSVFLEKQKWVLVRVPKNNLAYWGVLLYYSDTFEKRELWLDDVDVYTNDQFVKLYDEKSIYLSLNDFEFSLEVPEELEDSE